MATIGSPQRQDLLWPWTRRSKQIKKNNTLMLTWWIATADLRAMEGWSEGDSAARDRQKKKKKKKEEKQQKRLKQGRNVTGKVQGATDILT